MGVLSYTKRITCTSMFDTFSLSHYSNLVVEQNITLGCLIKIPREINIALGAKKRHIVSKYMIEIYILKYFTLNIE